MILLWPPLLLVSVGSRDGWSLVLCGALYAVCDLMLLFAMGLYRREAILEAARSLVRVPLVVGMGAVTAGIILSSIAALSGWPGLRHAEQMVLFALAAVVFTVCAVVARTVLRVLLHRRLLRRRLLVVGAGRRAWDLLLMLGREGASLHDDVILLHNPAFGPIDPRLLQERPQHIHRQETFDVAALAAAANADLVVVAPDERRGMDLTKLLACKKAGYPVMQYLTFVEREIRRIDLKRMELGWLVFSDGFNFGLLDRLLKRAFDLVVSSAVLLATAPLLLAGILAIRLEGPGGVFYCQERVTRDGRVFRILKLRTMRLDAEVGGAVWAARGDSRITWAGGILRRTRIDELPQLINILRGEMSFVGPRPERPMFVAKLAEEIPLYQERHMVKAGLTGWAQINYPYGASIDDARSKLSYDLYYVKNFSLAFDFVILMQTLREVLWPSGAR
ncbi:MAG: TIGR03013 family PEP-CTERM/XrtA system glycosyltransferase [Proteobacteria bacterium]|nr:TIGR03013 family PEP-CTERM/XrtA system glycosyltransferase [Pseudomonadota bacterium]